MPTSRMTQSTAQIPRGFAMGKIPGILRVLTHVTQQASYMTRSSVGGEPCFTCGGGSGFPSPPPPPPPPSEPIGDPSGAASTYGTWDESLPGGVQPFGGIFFPSNPVGCTYGAGSCGGMIYGFTDDEGNVIYSPDPYKISVLVIEFLQRAYKASRKKSWPSKDTSSCSVYPNGSILMYVCGKAGNGPVADSIRGCLQDSYKPGFGFPDSGSADRTRSRNRLGSTVYAGYWTRNPCCLFRERRMESLMSKGTQESLRGAQFGRLYYVLFGAVAFWLPYVGFEILTHRRASLILQTLLPFAVLVGAYLALSFARTRCSINRAQWMLVGIYLLGPLFLSIGAIPFQGGFSQFHGWRDLAYLLFFSLIPPLQLWYAAYEGAEFGMLLATVFLVIVGIRDRKLRRTD